MSDTAATPAAPLPTFVLRAPQHFWWEVKIPVATDSDYAVAKLDMLFLPVPQAELDKMRGQGLGQGEAMPTEDAIARRVVLGWRHLPDEHGNPVPYSEEAREQLLAVPMVRTHIVATYLAVMSGMAARKNG